MQKLSAVIITFNEEQNIERCLLSIVGVADDIVILDSFSTDATEVICKKYNVNFIPRKWEGYSETKNFANTQAKFDLILSLDADESLSEQLRRSILKIKENAEKLSCSFNRLNNYCGTWIKHSGWYPEVKIRLFDRNNAQWQGNIHEHLVFKNKTQVVHLKGDCLHYSYYSVTEHKERALKYAKLWAHSKQNDGIKSSLLKILYKPIATFLRGYVLHLGFLDGSSGFTIARITTWATYIRYSLLYNLNKNRT